MGCVVKSPEQRITVAVTGASGSIYAERLVEQLLKSDVDRIYLVASDAAVQVVRYELKPRSDGFSLIKALSGELSDSDKKIVRVLKNNDFFAPIASGSSAATGMVVVPCSMGTLGRIAHGLSSNLLERAADVMLKEKAPLVFCPRETPLSKLHLENMVRLTDLGAVMVPPMPAFYNHPKSLDDTIDFVVGRLLDALQITHNLYPRWNERML
jgi:4-hydroxy-3-polyprenylbenzoate decarboxylase